jgi:hypothetical protein
MSDRYTTLPSSCSQNALFTADGPATSQSPPVAGWLPVPSSSAAHAAVPVVRVPLAMSREVSMSDVDASRSKEAAPHADADASEAATADSDVARWTIARSASPLPHTVRAHRHRRASDRSARVRCRVGVFERM